MRAALALCVFMAACGDDDGALPFQDANNEDATRDDATPDTPPDGGGTLTTETMFAGGIGALCGLAYDHTDSTVWVFPCPGTEVHHFSATGTALGTVPRSGEATDDMDLHIARAAFTLGTQAVAAGDLLFINGENAAAEIYAPPAIMPALETAYGESHVVGGSYHVARNSLFLVQDRNGATGPNQIAEIDVTTGTVLNTFSTLPAFTVNYGDVEVCQRTGNLFVVSSFETTLAEFTPTGTLVAEYPLPAGFPLASGLGLDEENGAAWVSATNGSVIRMRGVPCGP